MTVEHEACDTSSSAEKTDLDGDGRPDIVRVSSGGREVCRMLDFNHDGIADSYVYLDAQGRVRRRESDFDRDGKIDEVDNYVDGVITRKDRATMRDGKFHTWDFYVAGKLDHRLRDSDGDGKVDQWWRWPNPDKPECAVVSRDLNGDGKPEDSTAADQCAPAAVSPPPVASASSTLTAADGGAPLQAAGAAPGADSGAGAVATANVLPVGAGAAVATPASSGSAGIGVNAPPTKDAKKRRSP